MGKMTNITYSEIKDTSSSKDNFSSVKQNYSSIDQSSFLKVLEDANRSTNFNYSNSQDYSSNESHSFVSKVFSSESSALRDYIIPSNTEPSYQENKYYEKESVDNFSNNQDGNYLNTNKQDYSSENNIKRPEETVTQKHDNNVPVNNAESTVKHKSETNSDNRNIEQKEIKKENPVESASNTNSKDKNVEHKPKEEKKTDIERDLLETRIHLATTVNINIAGNRVNENANKIEDKSTSGNSKESLSVKVIINPAQEKIMIKHKMSHPNQFEKAADNAAISDTAAKQVNNVSKPTKEENKSDIVKDKKDALSSQSLETVKTDNKSTQADNTKNPKKLEVKVQEDIPAIAALKQEQAQLSPSTQKDLREILDKEGAAKPVVTKLEVSKNLNDSSSGQKQKQNLAEEQSAKLASQASQSIQAGEANIATVGLERAASFDKVFESKLESRINANSLVNQVSDKLSSEIKTGKSEITMQLRPESLGKVEINLVSEKGIVTAQITTENSQVKEVLGKEIDALKQKLQDQGINLDKVVVKVQEPAQTNNNNPNFDEDSRKFNQSQTESNSSNFNSSKQAHEKMSQSNVNYDSSDLNMEPEQNTQNESSELHQGMVDYRI